MKAIESYLVTNCEEFITDHKKQDAILYNLIIIGETANQISEGFQDQ